VPSVISTQASQGSSANERRIEPTESDDRQNPKITEQLVAELARKSGRNAVSASLNTAVESIRQVVLGELEMARLNLKRISAAAA
jgi:hypothetical protein